MEKNKVFNFARIWLLSLAILDIIMFIYLIISGRTTGEIHFNELFSGLLLLIAVSSGIFGIFVFIYSIIKEVYVSMWYGVGLIIGGIILYLWVIVIAIANIF